VTEPKLYQDEIGQWVCQSCDERGLITGLGWTQEEAKARYAEQAKRAMKK
jgi:hypothetical protein